MFVYSEYLEQAAEPLKFEDAVRLFETIWASVDARDADGKELLDDFARSAVDYAAIRAEWLLLSPERKAETDPQRTRRHDAVIVSVNVLARYLSSVGRDASWREELGDNRKRIGDFACYAAALLGLGAR